MKTSLGWVRGLIWTVLVLFLLTGALLITKQALIRHGQARARNLAATYRQESERQHGKQSPRPIEPASQPLEARPLRELPFIKLAFSENPADREEFARVVNELEHVGNALARSRENGRNIHRIGHLIDFCAALGNLGLSVPEGMTDAQAAAQFLDHINTLLPALAGLRTALEAGRWDWGDGATGLGSRPSIEYEQAGRLVDTAALVLHGLIQARWHTGDSEQAWAEFGALHLLALRAADHPGLSGIHREARAQQLLARTVEHGLSLDLWPQEQLARVSELLAPFDAISTWRRGIAASMTQLDQLSEHPAEARAFFEAGSHRVGMFSSAVRSASFFLMGDSLIQDNIALLQADYEFRLAQLDPVMRQFLPPPGAGPAPLRGILADRSAMTDFYFMPIKDLMNWDERHAERYGLDPGSAVRSQTMTDHARLAAALELERRATGRLPDSLDAVAGYFPAGLPHDVATGQPYFYQPIEDGGTNSGASEPTNRTIKAIPNATCCFPPPADEPASPAV